MTKLPNYLAGLLASSAMLKGQTGVHIVTVAHDGWCDQLNNRGPCNCEPIVSPPKRWKEGH